MKTGCNGLINHFESQIYCLLSFLPSTIGLYKSHLALMVLDEMERQLRDNK